MELLRVLNCLRGSINLNLTCNTEAMKWLHSEQERVKPKIECKLKDREGEETFFVEKMGPSEFILS